MTTPDKTTPPERHFPYATIVQNDYPGFDESSLLHRDGVFRVNMWVSRDTFEQQTADLDAETIDYTAFDTVIPHPVYGKQSWLSVLNPDEATRETVKTLLTEAHQRATARYSKGITTRS